MNKNNRNIWILQTGEPLPIDSSSSRPMRAINLTNELLANNFDVTLWSSDFYHQERCHRVAGNVKIDITDCLKIRLIFSPGYKKNIGLGRLIDHACLAFNLQITLNQYNDIKPDVIFIGFPPIEVAYVMAIWARKNNIPYVIDVKDKWPDIFLDPFPSKIRSFVKVCLWPYFYMTMLVFKRASAFCTMSNSYLNWIRDYSKEYDKKYVLAPLVCPTINISKEDDIKARNWWFDCGVDLTHSNRFVFVGSISRAFDFGPILEVAKRFEANNIICEFVICGNGQKLIDLQNLSKGINNIVFPGWIDLPKINVIYKSSLATLAPYRNIDNFEDNVPNKIIDAFSNSIPIITSLNGEVLNLINQYKSGYHYKNSHELYAICLGYLNNPEKSMEHGQFAYRCYCEKFEFNSVYSKLIQFVKSL